MNYQEFERDFIVRTARIIDQYKKYVMPNVLDKDQFDVTLLINCMLGLLVLPKEKCYKSIPDVKADQLKDWGLESDCFPGRTGVIGELTLHRFVHQLRNAVAHFDIYVNPDDDQITQLEFKDHKKRKFKEKAEPDVLPVVMRISNLKTFVTRLAESVSATQVYAERNQGLADEAARRLE